MEKLKKLSIDQLISKAKKAAKQGNATTAKQLYQLALEHQPGNTIAKKGLAKLKKSAPGLKAKDKKSHLHPSQDETKQLNELFNKGHMHGLELVCESLSTKYPDSEIVFNFLGVAFKGQKKTEEAINAFNKAITLKPDFDAAYSNLGAVYIDINQIKSAIKCYDKAIEINPAFETAYDNRGIALLSDNQLNNALNDFEKAISIRENFASAHYHLSRIKKYKPQDPQIELMETLKSNSSTRVTDQVHLNFALAKAYEDLKDYKKSFQCLKIANHTHKKITNYTVDKDIEVMEYLHNIFSSNSLNNIVQENNTSPQVIFILGMPRSGTTLVEQIISSHSKVHGAGELSIINNLVSPVLKTQLENSLVPEKWTLSEHEIKLIRDRYLGELQKLGASEKIITDKSPLNFKWLGFILAAFPQAKIIHLNRDPIATCWSIYKHHFTGIGNSYAYDLDDIAVYYKHYKKLMSLWKKHYPEKIYNISYEKLTENQEEETRKLLRFCNLKWEDDCLSFHKSDRSVQTASAIQVRKKIYKGSSIAWKDYAQFLHQFVDKLEPEKITEAEI